MASLWERDTETRDSSCAILTQGLPLSRTLMAVANLAARLQPRSRCAVLLPDEDGFLLAAEVDLRDCERRLIQKITELHSLAEQIRLGNDLGADVRPLLTSTAELVGIMVVFNLEAPSKDESIEQQLDDICSIATLAIEQRNLSEELSYRANHDPLTHLWNRAWMEEKIETVLEDAASTGQLTGLIQLGIDSFSLFNELLGRDAGDELLRLIAARLNEALTVGCLLARTGSDEFTILIPDLRSANHISSFAGQLRSWLEKPFWISSHELIVRASFGTAVAAPGECHQNDLQNRADRALQFAKRFSRGRITAYSPETMKTPVERLGMERHLRFALQKREFELYYQPQVDLVDGAMIGMEALLRWKHPSLGFISPATFVPIAEEIGIIEEIGEWVLVEAIRQLEEWQAAGMKNVRMAVNVSACQFARADFPNMVAKRLRLAKIKPDDLELEITETAVMEDLQHGARQLGLLRALGVQTALDDFGTGHSSLAYLQQLRVDRLKIDRMFVKDITSSEERPALLASIIQMGQGIGCKVIAEGVETVEQALALSKMNCREAQGFLFSKPLPAADLIKWAASHTDMGDKLDVV